MFAAVLRGAAAAAAAAAGGGARLAATTTTHASSLSTAAAATAPAAAAGTAGVRLPLSKGQTEADIIPARPEPRPRKRPSQMVRPPPMVRFLAKRERRRGRRLPARARLPPVPHRAHRNLNFFAATEP
jgi:hypothetical protein